MTQRYLVGMFKTEEDVLGIVHSARSRDMAVHDVYSPYAIHGLDDALGLRPSRLTWVCFLGGAVGFDLSDPDVACGTIAMLGVNCGPCPHKDEEHCLSLHLADTEANNTGDTIQLIEEA